jgi:methionine-rich copper-binding protein CopC
MKSVATAAFAAIAAFAFAGAANAHAKLLSSTPVAKAMVAVPAEVVLRFSEPLIGKFSGASLSMTSMVMDGKMMEMPMDMGAMTAALDPTDSKVLVLKPKTRWMVGGYKLDWHAVSTDSHRVTGTLTFTVK